MLLAKERLHLGGDCIHVLRTDGEKDELRLLCDLLHVGRRRYAVLPPELRRAFRDLLGHHDALLVLDRGKNPLRHLACTKESDFHILS